MVNLTTKQIETFFGELEYIEPRLKALGVTVMAATRALTDKSTESANSVISFFVAGHEQLEKASLDVLSLH